MSSHELLAHRSRGSDAPMARPHASQVQSGSCAERSLHPGMRDERAARGKVWPKRRFSGRRSLDPAQNERRRRLCIVQRGPVRRRRAVCGRHRRSGYRRRRPLRQRAEGSRDWVGAGGQARPVAHNSDCRCRVHRSGGRAWLRLPPCQAGVCAANALASQHAVVAPSVRLHPDWRGRRRGQRGRPRAHGGGEGVSDGADAGPVEAARGARRPGRGLWRYSGTRGARGDGCARCARGRGQPAPLAWLPLRTG